MRQTKRRARRLCKIWGLHGTGTLLLFGGGLLLTAAGTALLSALHVLPLWALLCGGATALLGLAVPLQVEAQSLLLARATGAGCTVPLKRHALRCGYLLLAVRVALLGAALLPTAALFWLLTQTARAALAPIRLPLLVCCALSLAVSLGFFFRWNRLLDAAIAFLLCGVSFRAALRLSLRAVTARRRALAALRRSLFGWRLCCLFVLPLPFVWFYERQCRLALLLEPDFLTPET